MSTDTKTAIKNFKNLRKRVVLDGIIVGFFAGLFAVGYRVMLGKFDILRKSLFSKCTPERILMLICLFIGFSLVVSLMLKWAPLSGGSGIPQISGELLGELDMKPVPVIVSKFVGGGLANLAGLSLGREGPSIQIGGACGKFLAKIMKRDRNEERFMITAGASAGLAAAFNAPLSGTIFSLEEMHKNFSPLILLPCIAASVVADYITKHILGLNSSFYFIKMTEYIPLGHYMHILGIGIFSSLVGILFNYALLKGQDFHNKLPIPKIFKPTIAFMLSIVLGFTMYDVLGGGHHLVKELANPKVFSLKFLILLLIVKLVFTAISYGGSTQGGIFLPVLVLGGLSGCIYVVFFNKFGIIDISYMNNFVVLGMAGILTAVVRSPILSIMLVTEMVGSFKYMLAFCVVVIVAYIVAEQFSEEGIYESLLERILAHQVDFEEPEEAQEKELINVRISLYSSIINKTVKEIEFPKHALIVSIKRGEGEIIPNGETVINGGDTLTLLCNKEDLIDIKRYFQDI